MKSAPANHFGGTTARDHLNAVIYTANIAATVSKLQESETLTKSTTTAPGSAASQHANMQMGDSFREK